MMDNRNARGDLHGDLTVVDGCVFFSDGDASGLAAGGVSAVNLTVTGATTEFAEAADDLARWRSIAGSDDSIWKIVEHVGDIRDCKREGRVGLIMGWQNSRAFGDKLERIALFQHLGLRIVQMTYNDAELFGDGCLETRNGGLTRLGQAAVLEMNRVGITIDLSHCGERVCLDTAAASEKPVILSHANATSVFRQPRNKSDAVLKAVAATGGVVGASIHGFMNWNGDPAAPPSIEGWLTNVRYLSDVLGVDHVGFGTDFASVADDDSTTPILKASAGRFTGATGAYVAAFGNTLRKRYPAALDTPHHMGRKTEALEGAGFSREEIRKIMGENFIRVFAATWKASAASRAHGSEC